MAVTLTQMCQAVKDTMTPIFDHTWQVQVPSELKDGMNDTPTLQVYPENWSIVVSGTDRRSSRGGIHQEETIILCDLYARQRGHIGEDMSMLLPLIDAIIVKLEAQDVKPYFGLDGLKAFTWSGERVTFQYNSVNYIGARFTLTFTTF